MAANLHEANVLLHLRYEARLREQLKEWYRRHEEYNQMLRGRTRREVLRDWRKANGPRHRA